MGTIVKLAVPIGIVVALIGLLADWTGYLASPFAHALEFWGFLIFAAGFGLSMWAANKAKTSTKSSDKI